MSTNELLHCYNNNNNNASDKLIWNHLNSRRLNIF